MPGTVSRGFDSADGRTAVWALVLMGVAFVGQQVVARLSASVAGTVGARLDGRLQQRAIVAVNGPVGVRHLDDPAVQNQVSRVAGMGVGGYTPGGAVTGLTTRAGQWVQGVAAVVLIAFYQWWLAALIFAAQLVWGRVTRREYARQTKALVSQTGLLRRADYFRDLALTGGAAKEIRVFGLADWLVDRFRTEWTDAMAKVWAQRGTDVLSALALCFVLAANFLAFFLLGWDAARQAIGLGALVIFLRAVMSVATVSTRGRQDLQISHGVAAIPALLALEAAAAGVPTVSGRPVPVDVPKSEVAFHGVTFAYQGATTPVLKGFDLVIPSGRAMAVVGVNGAGKTTLVKLLARLYDPDDGQITVDGVDVREFDAHEWQRRIAAIFQDFTRYELSVRDNVTFGAIGNAGDERLLRRAAERAGIRERVEALDHGWDTLLTRQRAGGAELSGGEWQRVALARALFAVEAGAKILVLDEPTANLDVRAEAAFYERFLALTQGVTTIVVSHRFSTVRKADQICVVDGGKVLELGSHDELLAKRGRYAEMFASQSDHFLDQTPGEPK
ncbi:ABC transporter ATP-binding protein [Actinocrispum wychmicini]|uniref:ABC transporter ATP-binding protein n=1 Tax=Actinocrispum wychmicini TaxID=1213861 RepID=UPI001A9F2E23|nr:ABC transporter ATP-binding protein [Actinocrispum wychmicini]